MKTENLKVNQLSANAYQKYLSYLTAMDNKDVDTYGTFLAEDVEIWFNNSPFGSGKEVILEGLANYWQSFSSIEHDLTNIFGNGQSYVLEALNHYIRHDGKKTTVKAVAFTDLDEVGKVKSVRLYMDMTPVFAK